MAAEMSVWQRAARQRWKTAQVVGDGPFAMFATCSQAGRVCLYHFAQECVDAMNNNCGHAFCKMEHTAHKLRPVEEPAAPVQRAPQAISYGRDRD